MCRWMKGKSIGALSLAAMLALSPATACADALASAYDSVLQALLAGQDAQQAARDAYGASRVWFVSADGNNANTGLSPLGGLVSPQLAVALAQGGDAIVFGPGVFDLGESYLRLPDGVSVYGAGMYATTITGRADNSGGAIFNPGSRSTVADLTLESTRGDVLSYPFGYESAGNIFQDVTARRIRILGQTDGIFTAGGQTGCTLKVYDSIIQTKWDTIFTRGEGDRIELYNTVLIASGTTAVPGMAAQGPFAMAGEIYMEGGLIKIENGPLQTIGARTLSGKVLLKDVHIETATHGEGYVKSFTGFVYETGSSYSLQGGRLTSEELVLGTSDGPVAVPGLVYVDGGTLNVTRHLKLTTDARMIQTSGTISASSIESRGVFEQTGGTLSVAGTFRSMGTTYLSGVQNWASGSVLDVNGGTVTLGSNAGAAAGEGGAAVANLSINVNGSTVILAADQTLRSLNVPVENPGNQRFDLAGHAVRIYEETSKLAEAERKLISQLALRGVDGIYDSTKSPWEQTAVGITDQAMDVLGQRHILMKLTLQGDANLDGVVDFFDLAMLARGYGLEGATWDGGDLNYDGKVDFYDLNRMAQNYGKRMEQVGVSSGGATAVPEPSALGLLLGGLLMLRRRR